MVNKVTKSIFSGITPYYWSAYQACCLLLTLLQHEVHEHIHSLYWKKKKKSNSTIRKKQKAPLWQHEKTNEEEESTNLTTRKQKWGKKHTFLLHQISSGCSPQNDPLVDFLPKQCITRIHRLDSTKLLLITSEQKISMPLKIPLDP